MIQIPKTVVPIVLGVSLCGVSAVLLYILLKKDDEELETRTEEVESSKFCTKEKQIPRTLASAIIGRCGSTIKELEHKSGARLNLSDSVEDSEFRICTMKGSQVAITMAENLLDEIIEQQQSLETVTVTVPHWATGKIIGRGGENINNISRTSGAKITVTSPSSEKGTATQKSILIKGNPLQIKIASDMIDKCVAEDKRNRETDGKNREPRGKHTAAKNEKTVVGTDPGTKGSYPQKAPPAGSSGALLEVFVSAVSSPSRFWLQIVGPQVKELDDLVELMTKYYNDADNRELHQLSDVLIGQMVAAVFRHDGKWYRAKVVEIKPNEFDGRSEVCDVHFVDYGDNEYVAKSELLSLRTDFLTLRFQAVECFLAGVTPAPSANDTSDDKPSKWDNHAIERFEELTQVARWKRLWSRTCAFKERPKLETGLDTARTSREGSPIPGVKLYDTIDNKDINISEVLIDEGWAVEVEEEINKPLSVNIPVSTPSSILPPPTFGDLGSSRVLGMVDEDREERASSLPHGGSSPSYSPHSDHKYSDSSFQNDDLKPKSLSLASGIDNETSQPPKSPGSGVLTELSYPTPEANGFKEHVNGSSPANKKNWQNGDFLNSERGASNASGSTTPKKEKPLPFHVPDPKDELKAKMNRVDSHHGSLENLGRHTPPLSIVNPTLHKNHHE